MRIRSVQFSPRLADVEHNFQYHRERITQAVSEGLDLIVFPELSLTGYHLKDAATEVSMNLHHPFLTEIRALSEKIDIVLGLVLEEIPGIVYNAAIWFSGGTIAHIHKKTQLPNFGMFQEAMIFKPGDQLASFQVGKWRVGLLICREILFPINAYLYFIQNVDLIIGISNSPFRGFDSDGFASLQLWESMGYIISVFYQTDYLFVNRTGFEDGMGFGGGSFLARAGRGIEKRSAYFADEVMDCSIGIEDIRRARLSGNYLRDTHADKIFQEMQRILHG